MINEDIAAAALPTDAADSARPLPLPSLRRSQSSHPFPSPAGQQQQRMEPMELERIFTEYIRTRDARLREILVLHHQRLVRSIVNRILISSSRGESFDDLMQVGSIGLIKALDRFDPAMGARFSTYGTRMILGEIQKHLRDRVSPVKVPRALQSRHYALHLAAQELMGKLGRPAAIVEIAQRLSISEEEVLEAMEAGGAATSTLSLDSNLEGGQQGNSSSSGGDGITVSLLDLVGSVDPALAELETRGDLHAALQALEGQEKEIITLLFFEDMSQTLIAARLGISQMQVSRLQQRALQRLRRILTDEARLLCGRHEVPEFRKARR